MVDVFVPSLLSRRILDVDCHLDSSYKVRDRDPGAACNGLGWDGLVGFD